MTLVYMNGIFRVNDRSKPPIFPLVEERPILKQEVGSSAPDGKLTDRAVETFGVTNNPEEAGYILPGGRMLDFSE